MDSVILCPEILKLDLLQKLFCKTRKEYSRNYPEKMSTTINEGQKDGNNDGNNVGAPLSPLLGKRHDRLESSSLERSSPESSSLEGSCSVPPPQESTGQFPGGSSQNLRTTFNSNRGVKNKARARSGCCLHSRWWLSDG